MDRLTFRKGSDAAGYTILSNLVLLDHLLSDGAKVTYLVLLYHARQAGACFPGQEKLAAERGVSDRSVRSHLKELQERGLITVERRGRAKTNLYWIEDLEAIYRKGSSTQADDRKNPSARDRKILAAPTTLNKTQIEQDSETFNVARVAAHMLSDIRNAVEATGDHKSTKRFSQLFAITQDAGMLCLWDEAMESLRIRMLPGHKLGALRRPGAYFCKTLTDLLAGRGVYVPVGHKAEREDVRRQIAESLATASNAAKKGSS